MPKWSREYLPSLILSGLVLILSAMVILEWAWLQPGALHSTPHANHHAHSGEGQVAVEESPLFELPSLDEFSATVEHPLFAENRLPPAEEELEAAIPVVSTPLTLKLMGVIFTPRQQTALMQDAKGKYKRLRHNDTLDGWTLMALSGDRVTLQQGNEQKELVLLKPRPKPPSGAQTPHPKPVIQETGEEESEDTTDNPEEVVNDESVDEESESPND